MAVAGAFTVAVEGMRNMEDWAFYSVERTTGSLSRTQHINCLASGHRFSFYSD